jgi:hypothetical protein
LLLFSGHFDLVVTNMIAKCECRNCSQPIEFPEEMTGQIIECPNCKLETVLSIQPPSNPTRPKKPEPATVSPSAAKAEPKTPQKIYISKPPFFQIFFQLITASAAVVCAVFIYQATHQPQLETAQASWEYSEFEFPSSSRGMSITYYEFDQKLNETKSDPRPVIAADETLSVLGRDGWQLAWTDGDHYLVKRQEGNWKHSSFSVGN